MSGDSEESDIEIEDLFDDYDLEMTLTREEFNSICGEIFDKIFARTKRFVDNSKEFKIDDIGRIILAGGTCYIPLIGETIEKMFGIEPEELDYLFENGCFPENLNIEEENSNV